MEKLFYALKAELGKVDHLEQMIVWVTLHETQVSKEMFEKFGFRLAGTLSKTVKYQGKYYDCCWLEAPLK
jgi:L-amino acid N-acyltransferase YncA